MDDSGSGVADVRSVAEAVSGDGIDAPLYEIESLCMRCGENGTTRFLLTVIPHFRNIVLSAFECPDCGERNNEVQFAGELQPGGCCYTLHVSSLNPSALNRQIVKSDHATIKIPELDFEIPPEAQKGTLSTVEGVLTRAEDGLMGLQEQRKLVDPERAEAIDEFLVKLKACIAGQECFTFILDDPSGNSFIENPSAPLPDPSLTLNFYARTAEQQRSMGYSSSTSEEARTELPHMVCVSGNRAIAMADTSETLVRYSSPEEVMTFPSTCGACSSACESRMFLTKIPHFQEVIIMASSCDACGYRNSELKPGGRVPERGRRIVLRVVDADDLIRDVIKSDTAGIRVPELDLELSAGTLGGVVTTVEGLMVKISDNLERIHGFMFGDSVGASRKTEWDDFLSRIKSLLRLEKPWSLVIDDAMANSFIAPISDDVDDDKRLVLEDYERSWEENEELGLNDIDTSSVDAPPV